MTRNICGIELCRRFQRLGFLVLLYPQFALWATNMPSASRTLEFERRRTKISTMKVIFSTLLITVLSITCLAQKMTDRDLEGLKSKVKSVDSWSEDTGSDGKPVRKPEAHRKPCLSSRIQLTKFTVELSLILLISGITR